MILFIKENTAGICLIIILLIFLIRGLKKGLIAMAAAVASIVFTLYAAREITPRILACLNTNGILLKITEWFGTLFGKGNIEEEHSKLYELLGLGRLADSITGAVTEIIIRIICFIVLFILIRIIIKIIVGILKGIRKIKIIGFLDSLSGGAVGLAEGIFWSWAVITVIELAGIEAVKLQIASETIKNGLLQFIVNNNLLMEFIRDFIA